MTAPRVGAQILCQDPLWDVVMAITPKEKQLAGMDITQKNIMQVAKLAAFFQRRAASHVVRLVGLSEEHAAYA